MAKKVYVGVNNVARKVKKMYIGIDGKARRVKKAYIGVNGVARLFYQLVEIPINTTYTFTEDGTFTVPADGRYQIELHGGGGGGGGAAEAIYTTGGRRVYVGEGGYGGGSGEIFTTTLTEGSIYPITIGLGGSLGASDEASGHSTSIDAQASSGSDGGTTSFGNLFSVSGGKGGGGGYATAGGTETAGSNGSSSGSLASGSSGGATIGSYGNGGRGSYGFWDYEEDYFGLKDGSAGTKGVAIITYLGE